ncbi:MAG: VWA domain-containing protein [Pseudomonadota bacterium]
MTLELILLRPAWCLALLPVAGMAWWVLKRGSSVGDWGKAANPVMMQAMAALGRIDAGTRRWPQIALLGAVAVAVIALAGPAIERRDAVSYRNLDGVIFVVDVDSAVTEHPLWQTMQTSARFALGGLGTRPAALIVYDADAYLATDMTLDHLQLGQTFSLIGADTVPDHGADMGAAPARGLALAARVLRDAGVLAGDVVLLTDGQGLGSASLQQIALISETGARVSVLALDTPTVESITHAAAGGGQVFGPSDTTALNAWLSEDARTRLEQQDYPLLFWHDLGRYLLWLALLPVLLLFRREAL